MPVLHANQGYATVGGRHRQSRLTIDRSAPPFWQGLAAWRSDEDASESQRVEALSAFVENQQVSGVFEVIDTVED